jgi:hypothetical protein
MKGCVNNYLVQIVVDLDLLEEKLMDEVSHWEDDRPTIVIQLEDSPKKQQLVITNDVYLSPLGDSEEVTFHDFQNPLGSLVHALVKVNVLFLLNISLGFGFHYELHVYTSLCLLTEEVRRILVNDHLLFWLHWEFHTI